ncbi:MAG: hypothetical protein FJ303_03955 [Planctomycetes bacterium]|nr:hypothetical protein [Planctomycetota bacterium]
MASLSSGSIPMPNEEQPAFAVDKALLHDADLRDHPHHLCVDTGVLRLAIKPEFRGHKAMLVDVSAGGIGFLLEVPLEPGTMLTFELKGSGEMGPVSRVARVRHSRPHPCPPNAPWLPPTPVLSRFFRQLFGQADPAPEKEAWLIGCMFDRPMSDAEIAQLLNELQPPQES